MQDITTETETGTYQLANVHLQLLREVTYFAEYETGVDEFGFEWRGDYATALDQATTDAQALADARREPIAIVDPTCADAPIVAIVEPTGAP